MSDILSSIDDVLGDTPGSETPVTWEKVSPALYTAEIAGIAVEVRRSGRQYAAMVPGSDILSPVRTVAEGKAEAERIARELAGGVVVEDVPGTETATDDAQDAPIVEDLPFEEPTDDDDYDADFVPGSFGDDGEFTPETDATEAETVTPEASTADVETPGIPVDGATAQLMAQVAALQAQLAALTPPAQATGGTASTAAPDPVALSVRIIDDAMSSGQHPEAQVYRALEGWHRDDVIAQGQEVASEIRDALSTYMKFPDALADAYAGTLTLWALHTHLYYHQGVTPYLLVSSPTAGAGKSTLIGILSRVVRQPAIEVNPTAAVARSLAGEGYTLLLDEVDELYTGKDFKSILNAGYKRGGAVSRMKGKGVQRDIVFSPKLMAGIGREGTPIEGALLDRCVQIWLERAMPGERPWFDTDLISEALRERVVTWARNAVSQVARHPLDMPALPSSRSLEIWGPLVAVADVLGGSWGGQARDWAVEIESRKETQADPNVQILTDTREVMLEYLLANPHETTITAERLLEMRNTNASRQFTGALTNVSFGKRLSRFGIKTTPVRGVRVFKIGDGFGNLTDELQRIFARYCD